ncbi:MAG: hypothetical protein FJ265_22195, partial [Planctomycetes bacterium]|nr:hypothetical protein [Planctomycetota bacterium]
MLNPWQLDQASWNSAVGLGGGAGGRYGGRAGGGRGKGAAPKQGEGGPAGPHPGTFANVDWLPRGAAALHNLVPGADGTVRVKLADLGDGQIVRVLAIDGDQALQQTLVRAEAPLTPRARQLAVALDGGTHFVEQKRIEFVAAGSTAVLGDVRAGGVEIYDSLAAAFRLLLAANRDESLAKFAFVLQWPKLADADKQKLYSEHACHELHFFLYHKDRKFFDAVVRPFLVNKHQRTFLDHWLLGDDLKGYTEPWAFAQLNLVEKILLAGRLGGTERDAVARLLREALELKPVDRERLEALFDLAYKSGNLEQEKQATKLGLEPPPPPAAAAPAPAEAPSAPATGGVPRQEQAAGAEGAPAARRKAKDDERAGEDKDAGRPAAAAEMDRLEAGETLAKKLGEEARSRGRVSQLYRAVEPTKLYVEHDWWHRRLDQTTPDVVAPNQFWVDYAMAPAGAPFVSAAVVQTANSFLEAMMALSVLDLPFEAGKHEVTADGDQRTLKAATPLLLVRKEITRTEKAADLPPLLLGENFFRLDDRYRFENGERRDAFVTDEFLVDVAYGCQVVVTNPTSQKRTTELLLQ